MLPSTGISISRVDSSVWGSVKDPIGLQARHPKGLSIAPCLRYERSIASSDDSSDQADLSDTSEEELMEAQAASDAAYVQSVRIFVLAADYMGLIDTEPPRALRQWQVEPGREDTDMYKSMCHHWPRAGAHAEDRKYTTEFRVDRQTFDMMHNEVRVSLQPAMQGCYSAHYKSMLLQHGFVTCRICSPRMIVSRMTPSRKRFAAAMCWQMVATTRQLQHCLAWPHLLSESFYMKRFR